MSDPQPIRQPIEAVFNDGGLQAATRALDELERKQQQGVEQSRQAVTATEREDAVVQRFGGSLRELIHRRDQLRRKQEEGTELTEREQRELGQTDRRVERLSRSIATLRDRKDRLNREMNESIGAYRRTEDAQEKMGQSLGGLAARFGPAALAAGTLYKTLQQLRAEYDLIIETQQKAFQANIPLASAERSLKLNLAGSSDEEIAAVLAERDRIADRYDIPAAQTTLALASAISATGGDVSRGVAFTELSARIRPDQPTEIGGIAGALGDVATAIGTDNPLEALGFLQTTGALSRVADSSQQFRNIPAAITGTTAFGFSPQEAGALFSALTVGSADLQGATSRTASISFAEQLSEFFREQRAALDDPKQADKLPEGAAAFLRSQTGDLTGGAAIAALQQQPELRALFLEGLSVEKQSLAPLRDLVSDPTSTTASLFAANVGRFGSSESLTANAQQSLRQLEAGDTERIARLDRALASTEEVLLTSNKGGAEAGVVRERLRNILTAAGQSDLDTDISGVLFDLRGGLRGEDAIGQAIDLVQARRDQLLRTRSRPVGGYGPSLEDGYVAPAPSAQSRQRAEVLESLADQLTELQREATRQPAVINNYHGTNIIGQGHPDTDDLRAPADAEGGR